MTTTVIEGEIYQGEGKWFPFNVVDLNGDAVDLTDASFVFHVKSSIGGTLLYAATTFDVTDLTNGNVRANLPASQTLTMDPGTYYAQFLVVVANDTDVEISNYLKFKVKEAVVENLAAHSVSPSISVSISPSRSPSLSPSLSPSRSPSLSPSISPSPSA